MKKGLGQFFSTNQNITKIFNELSLNSSGSILEPSLGEGNLLKDIDLKNRPLFVVEYDKKLKKNVIDKVKNYKNLNFLSGCFFDQKLPSNFSTIISNPPYVNKKEYLPYMSKGMSRYIIEKEYSGKYNTAYLFIHRCAELLKDQGEMIFIVPKDFSSNTSAKSLRQFLSKNGHFTHWIDCGESRLFSDASLETLTIFRWVKGNSKTQTKFYSSINNFFENKYQTLSEMYLGDNLILFFSTKEQKKIFSKFVNFGDLFSVYVGSVSGADEIFKVKDSLINSENKEALDFFTTGPHRKECFINSHKFSDFESMPKQIKEYLLLNKKGLLKRSTADETNWWKWSFIRNAQFSLRKVKEDKIVTFFKTRTKNPFLIGDYDGFVGSVYGIYPKQSVNLEKVLNILNSPFYRKLYLSSGMAVKNKFQATPSAIKDIPFPPLNKIDQVSEILSRLEDEDSAIKEILSILS